MPLNRHSAPGVSAAFTYQFERAMFWLAKSPAGYVIGIETCDDVAIRGADGTQILEQDKHSIRDDAKPFDDRSKDLWNTLSIWIKALDDGEVSADTTRFFMVTNKKLPDCIARQISLAESKDQITSCVEKLEAAAQKPPDKVAKFMKRVLLQRSRESLINLIERCELVDASDGSAGPELRKETINHLPLPEWCLAHSDSITNELYGWLVNASLALWQENKPAWIGRNHFINQLHAIIDCRKRQNRRERAAILIPVSDEKIGQEKGRSFVKQIHLVTPDDNIVVNAICEFIRCNTEKMRLSAEGNITDEDWLSFESALQNRWEKIRARVVRMSRGKKEEDIGFEIFTDTTENYREKLAGIDTEQVYLTSGAYHQLADVIRVGWHPRFEELIQEGEEM